MTGADEALDEFLNHQTELAWFAPLRRCLRSLLDLEVLLSVHESGMEALVVLEDVVKNIDGFPQDFVREMARDAGHASNATGSSLMFGHATIGLWAQLEVLVEDLACAWMATHPETLELPDVAKVRIPLAEFARLSEDERIRVLILELQRNLRADLAEGTTRFDRITNAIGIGGELPDQVRKAIFELWHVRNVWAHRAGIADQKFVNRCPWLGYAVGQGIDLDLVTFNYYLHAVHVYCGALSNRCRELSGLSRHGEMGCLDTHIQHMEAHALWDPVTSSRRVGPPVKRVRWELLIPRQRE